MKKKINDLVIYLIYLTFIVILFDHIVFHNLLGFGYPRHFKEENVFRFPTPYVSFTGKPGGSHNKYGFRGKSLEQANKNDLKIAFFGGSTGYLGDPPIANLIEKYLNMNKNLPNCFVANYSVVSSNHRQHLHGIIEFLSYLQPDLIIFYGGYNETIQNGTYDPRPGYPFNYFYRAETKPLSKLFIENSAILGEIDKRFNILTGLRSLREKQKPFQKDWNKRIVNKYFETLDLAKTYSEAISSKYFGKTKFIAFYQPYQVPDKFQSAHNLIKQRITMKDYIYDVSESLDNYQKQKVYEDIVHVNQFAKTIISEQLTKAILRHLSKL